MSRASIFSLLVAVIAIIAVLALPSIIYPGVPREVVRNLAGRGCRIVGNRGIVAGQFTGSPIREWATLCQVGDRVSFLVYTPGRAAPAILSSVPGSGSDEDPECGRGLRLVSLDYVVRHNPGHPITEIPQACLEDGIGMGSLLYCYLGGKWVGLAGAD